MIYRNLVALGALLAAGVLVACGGGGGGSSTVPGSATNAGSGGSGSLPAGDALVTLTITKPASSSSGSATSRSPKYIAPNTSSISFLLLDNNGSPASGATTQGPFAIASGSPGCTTDQAGDVTCSFGIDAPIGSDIFLATTFTSTTGAAGTQNGSGAVALSVVENASNAANLTLSGPIAQVVLAASNPALWDGNGSYYSPGAASAARKPQVAASPTAAPTPVTSTRIFVIAEDAAGNVILNPTTYNQPIILTLSDGSGPANLTLANAPAAITGSTCSASSTSVNAGTIQVCSPADVVTLALNTSASLQYQYLTEPTITASLGSPPTGFTAAVLSITDEDFPTPTISFSPTSTSASPIAILGACPSSTPYADCSGSQAQYCYDFYDGYCYGGYYTNPVVPSNAGTQYVTISETYYYGSFSITNLTDPNNLNGYPSGDPSCQNVVSATMSEPDQVAIEPLGPGFCNITVSDTNGLTSTIYVSVTTTTVNGQ